MCTFSTILLLKIIKELLKQSQIETGAYSTIGTLKQVIYDYFSHNHVTSSCTPNMYNMYRISIILFFLYIMLQWF